MELAEAKVTAVAQTKNQLAPLKSANASLNKALADLDALLKPLAAFVAPRIDLAERFAGKRITIQREVIRNGKTTLVNVGTFLLDSRGNVVLSKSLKITRGTKLRVSAPGESVTRITAK